MRAGGREAGFIQRWILLKEVKSLDQLTVDLHESWLFFSEGNKKKKGRGILYIKYADTEGRCSLR